MKITRAFSPGDRYQFDFGMCSTKKGYAQVDTEQDASYFGTWANPEQLSIINYCEGDITLTQANNEKEFVDEIHRIKAFHEKLGYRFLGIDPGFNDRLSAQFKALGLSEMLPEGGDC